MGPGPDRRERRAQGRWLSQAGAGVAEPLEQAHLERTGWRRAGLVVLQLGHHGRRQGGIRLEGVLEGRHGGECLDLQADPQHTGRVVLLGRRHKDLTKQGLHRGIPPDDDLIAGIMGRNRVSAHRVLPLHRHAGGWCPQSTGVDVEAVPPSWMPGLADHAGCVRTRRAGRRGGRCRPPCPVSRRSRARLRRAAARPPGGPGLALSHRPPSAAGSLGHSPPAGRGARGTPAVIRGRPTPAGTRGLPRAPVRAQARVGCPIAVGRGGKRASAFSHPCETASRVAWGAPRHPEAYTG